MSYDPNAPGSPGRPPEQQPGSVAMPGGHPEQQHYPTEQHYQQQPYPPQYGAPQGQHPGGSGGPNFGVMAPRGRPGVHFYPFWQRSEFWTFLATAIAVGIAAAAADTFDSTLAWTLITILATAYILSRGLAKREPRSDEDDKPWEPGSSGRGR